MEEEETEHFMKLYKMGCSLYDEKKFEDALTVFQELVLYTEVIIKKDNDSGKQDCHLLEIYGSLLPQVGFCLFELERNDEALVYYMKAYSIAKKHVAENGSAINKHNLAWTAYLVGDHLSFIKRYDEALKYYRVGMKMLKLLFDEPHFEKGARQMFVQVKKSYNEALTFSNTAEDQSKLYHFIDEGIDDRTEE